MPVEARMHTAVIDVGKPENLGWVVEGLHPAEGNDLGKCVDALATALRVGSLALGFEAPMFVPMRDDPLKLTKARDGECIDGISRPFSSSVGSSVLVTGLT